MKIVTFIRKSATILRQNPYLWLLALIAIVSDVGAVFSYDPSQIHFPTHLLWMLPLSLIAEVGLIYAFIQHTQGKTSTFVDSFMMSVTSLPRVLPLKAVILLAPALFSMLIYITAGLSAQNTIVQVIIITLALLLLLIVQIWTIFALCSSFFQEYSIGEAMTQAWHTLWGHKAKIMQMALPFLVVDLLLISLLVVTGAVSYDSTFLYTVTDEMAQQNVNMVQTGQRTNAPGPTEAGKYFRINRVMNGYGAALLRARGVKLLSIPMFFVDNRAIGLIAVAIGMVLIPLRISVWTLTYLELAEPVPEFQSVIQAIHLERQTATTTSGASPQAQQLPTHSTADTQSDTGWVIQVPVQKQIRWILVGVAFPLLLGVFLFGLCQALRAWQIWIFSQPWEHGPLEGCPNWLPLDSRKPHFDDAPEDRRVFCVWGEGNTIACQGKFPQVSEPITQEFLSGSFMPRCQAEFSAEVQALVQEGTVLMSFQDLEGVTSPVQAHQEELLTVTGTASQATGFTITFEAIEGEAQNVCLGAKAEYDCRWP